MTLKKHNARIIHIAICWLIAVFYFTSMVGCSLDRNHDKILAFNDSLKIPPDSSTKYFPEKDTSKNSSFNNALQGYSSKILFYLHEPVLYNYTGKHKIFRFTWLRSFDNPISFRLEKGNQIITLFIKEIDGERETSPGKINLDTTISITEEKWNTFIAMIDTTKFWKLPLETNYGQGFRDGSEWILEGVDDKKYHAVKRFSPPQEKAVGYRTCCQYLIKLSGIDIPNERIY